MLFRTALVTGALSLGLVACTPAAVPTAAIPTPAPAVQAIATQAAPAAATVAATSPVRIVDARLNPTGPALTVENAGQQEIDLAGWRLRVGEQTLDVPSNARMGPGETLTLHLGPGTTAGRDVFLGAEATALATGLQPGARIELQNNRGEVVAEIALPG